MTFLDVEVASSMVRESELPANGAPIEAIGLAVGTTHDGLRLILAQTWDAAAKMAKVVRIPVSSIQKMVLLSPSS